MQITIYNIEQTIATHIAKQTSTESGSTTNDSSAANTNHSDNSSKETGAQCN